MSKQFIFLDESGDLGFDFSKKRTSRHFIITCLFAPNHRAIQKVVRNVHSGLKRQHKQKSGVLHAYHEKPITIQRMLRGLVERDIQVMSIILNKEKVYTRLHDEKAVVYNYVTNILLDRILTRKLLDPNMQITLVASRKDTSSFLNANFKTYLSQQIKRNHRFKLAVLIKTPPEEKCLQAVDFVSWSLFRKYEYGDSTYYNLIKPIIVEENPLFP